MKLINKGLFNKLSWLVIILVALVLVASSASAFSVTKDPEAGVMLSNNETESAYYISPATKEKLVLATAEDAFLAMTRFGLGIKHTKLQSYLNSAFPKNLAGSILLDVNNRGQAYYISAIDLKAYFLGKPDNALLILKANGFKLNKPGKETKINNVLARGNKTLNNQGPIVNNITIITNPILPTSGFSKIIGLGANITNNNNFVITEQGIVWSLFPNPNLKDNNKGLIKAPTESNNFTVSLDNITPSTTYYFKAYAIINNQAFYGNEEKFTSSPLPLVSSAPNPFVCGDTVSYSGELYPTTLVGGQCWMAKNLNIGNHVLAASAAPCTDYYISPGLYAWSCQNNDNQIEKYCYDNTSSNCATDGGLYEWAEALALPHDCNNAASIDNGNGTYTLTCPDSGEHILSATPQGICPSGWHLPYFSEWQALAQNFDPGCDLNCDTGACSCLTAGGDLKATASHAPIAWDGAADIYNFSVLPAGYRIGSGLTYQRGSSAFIWSATPGSGTPLEAWWVHLGSGGSGIDGYNRTRTSGFSVRCVKN